MKDAEDEIGQLGGVIMAGRFEEARRTLETKNAELFVCLHGAAKSVIGAAHFRRLATARFAGYGRPGEAASASRRHPRSRRCSAVRWEQTASTTSEA